MKWIHEGLITESLPNTTVPGDKVKIEVSRYDSTRGR
uniref:Translation initiation factor 1 n=2 Tax=Elaeocarpus TaxID=26005 RepID=A0A7S8WTR4_9ROSI|nr:translation initiation factor 1 [Elaeocarpus braceanus]YP_010193740.1 translation initiation factor 1 [Elaeocarpus decipiens]YP_010413174.1 Translation initiation factor IF-1 [Elaeocarpus glabripetalus]YP_010703539.1 translational initiation factor 1 [Elaeocarpus duclouxii]QNQ65535.1 Translation initiation factor IF-1 [Elaeocarpus japonicus]QPF22941.1 translation initiation factor 1 [Elaeocarpus braceanus]QXO02001.1 translational initiation factor 1 [Elaeocarpus glabripetalus]QZQ52917.1 t